MMRLAIASSGLGLVLVSTMLSGQQVPARNLHKEPPATKAHGGKPRPEYRPDYAQNKVEVINGATAHTVVFDEGHLASTPPGKEPAQKAVKGSAQTPTVAPSQVRVDVVNGMSSETEYFEWDPERQQGQPFGMEHARPVVVGIESSNTRIMGGNKHPLVVGIESIGSGEAAAQKSAPKLEYRLVPQPKRPPYRPFDSQ